MSASDISGAVAKVVADISGAVAEVIADISGVVAEIKADISGAVDAVESKGWWCWKSKVATPKASAKATAKPVAVDVSGADISGADISGADVSGAVPDTSAVQAFTKAVVGAWDHKPKTKAEAIAMYKNIMKSQIEPVIKALLAELIAELPVSEKESVTAAVKNVEIALAKCGCW